LEADVLHLEDVIKVAREEGRQSVWELIQRVSAKGGQLQEWITKLQNEKEELALTLSAQENSIKCVLEAIFTTGHNNDCLFCGLKDSIILRAAEQWGIPLDLTEGSAKHGSCSSNTSE
jgi:hypothetical protein